MASSALAEWRVEQLADHMTDRFLKFAAIAAIGVLAVSPAAHADPVHMACSGEMLLPNKGVDTNTALSLTIDVPAGAATVGGDQPVSILPSTPAGPGISDGGNNEVSFFGATTQGVLSGRVDRVTGEANITFHTGTSQERFLNGF